MIVFLFLTRGNLNHLARWQRFFKNVDKSKYIIITHTSKDVKLKSPLTNTNIRTVPTAWGKITHAIFELLKESLKYPATHVMLLSESCVPLYTFDYMHKYIKKQNKIIVNYLKIDKWNIKNIHQQINSSHIKENKRNKFLKNLVKHNANWAMPIKYVKLLLKIPKKYIDIIHNMKNGDEYLFSLLTMYKGKSIIKQQWWVYSDWEYCKIRHAKIKKQIDAIYNDSYNNKLLSKLKDKSRKAYWHPKTFKHISLKTYKRIIATKALFVRKCVNSNIDDYPLI
uniref:Core-2/I-branching enzyme n=1 Tax=Megaviridae environmental sample TaxID=1737588 RepID=A0A5J6VHU3_9VIRU|nr:MAG: core-2/I-branching enzyme [Megaviridae environmental sample]